MPKTLLLLQHWLEVHECFKKIVELYIRQLILNIPIWILSSVMLNLLHYYLPLKCFLCRPKTGPFAPSLIVKDQALDQVNSALHIWDLRANAL